MPYISMAKSFNSFNSVTAVFIAKQVNQKEAHAAFTTMSKPKGIFLSFAFMQIEK